MREGQDSMASMFGCNVFNDDVMRQRLPKNIYTQLRNTIDSGAQLEPSVAEVVASAMKEWAVERGATHYTHWFQPLTGKTAEKHDAFLTPSHHGGAILEFSGKELVRGESDASSFPSGGLRATFEARGYTAWDCTSPAFIREDPSGIVALCIPTAFCSYGGEALDLRTPLLRSMQALSCQAVRVLRALGDDRANRVYVTVGLEQEYFLLDRDHFRSRRDLIYTGRTLLGARAPKGQELDDQYYGVIRQRVSAFMHDVNSELWKLGVAAKTQHNEAAPAQHEVAVVYENANIASDQNQLTLLMLGKVAARHNLACLAHEKPFEGVNGSGKHDNWSLATDTGENLLSPGDEPECNLRFLLFFMAVIAAVDEYAPLLRAGCACASNDHRLGSHEAPPAIISVFIGDTFHEILESLGRGDPLCARAQNHTSLGVDSMPRLELDNSDRNRTSTFAFTGNKFELRMLGASQSPSTANTYLNAMVADKLEQTADILEAAEDREKAAWQVVADLYKKHKRVIFNGDSYTQQWRDEAKRRGLPCAETTVEAIRALSDQKNTALLSRYRVLSPVEQESRALIMLESYIKALRIEARTLSEMAHTQVLPAVIRYQTELAHSVKAVCDVGVQDGVLRETFMWYKTQADALSLALDKLDKAISNAPSGISEEVAAYWRDEVLSQMKGLRQVSDKLETRTPRDSWPLVTYGELMFYK